MVGHSRSRVLAAGAVASTAVGVLAPAEQAEALSCGCLGILEVLAPEPGATEVPVDAYVWVLDGYAHAYYGDAPAELALINAVGEPIELVPHELAVGDQSLRVGIPVEPLAPNTLYQAFACSDGVCDRMLTEFTTGAGTDVDAPPLPSISGTEPHVSKGIGPFSCGRQRALALDFDHEGILVADLGDAQLDAEALEGSITAATTSEQLFVGVGLCENLWPGDEGATLPARFGVFDVSGNFSGWTEPEPLELPSQGCSTTHDTPARGAWTLLLLLAGWVRRPRPDAHD